MRVVCSPHTVQSIFSKHATKMDWAQKPPDSRVLGTQPQYSNMALLLTLTGMWPLYLFLCMTFKVEHSGRKTPFPYQTHMHAMRL